MSVKDSSDYVLLSTRDDSVSWSLMISCKAFFSFTTVFEVEDEPVLIALVICRCLIFSFIDFLLFFFLC